MKVCIGEENSFDKIPLMIDIKNGKFLLTKNEKGKLILLNADCPHQHGIVEEIKENCFRCPNHGYTFDKKSGQSINAPQVGLELFEIENNNGKLFVDLPEEEESFKIETFGKKEFPKITLVSNATLLIEYKETKILTDPWMEGPAMYGSWIQYPPSTIKISDLPKIDFIFVTHEHSDHFNKKTLSQFDKNIPIYVPHFGNGRLVNRVKALGFKNVVTMASGQIIKLNENVKSISFKSESLWNDSILYIQLGNFKILNINDAGFNLKIPKIIGDVDLVCSSFSFGASAYPLSWTHLDLDMKKQIVEQSNQGLLKMIKQIVEACKSKYFLPFANFTELGPIELRDIAKLHKKNTPKTVIDFFKENKINCKVLDMFPGESWEGKNIQKRDDHNRFFDRSHVIPFLEENYSCSFDKEFTPSDFTIGHKTIKKYFEGFTNSDLSKKVGKYSISFTAFDKEKSLHALIKFNNGIITYTATKIPEKAELSMECMGGIVQDIILNDMSWDEITYSAKYSRINDEFNIALWKIFHAPWEGRKKKGIEQVGNVAIATILEKGGLKANKIFEKYGLFCASCDASIGENVDEGCKIHGIEKEKADKLKFELNQLISLK